MTAPEILDTASPYWLRLYGHWVNLQGIMPIVDQTPGRGFSELVTVDGYRYEQRAPRGPRAWTYDYRYGTVAATAALESAAYDMNFDDPAMRTLFLDTNAAKANMVPPDLLRRWRNPEASSGPLVFNVGESEGLPMWLPTYDGDGATTTRTLQVTVRGGVTYMATVWTTLGGAQVALSVSGAAVANANGTNGATAAAPAQATATFTPAADGVVNVSVASESTAGLMVYEGDCPPTSYRAGQRMPCSISVHDPKRTQNLVWSACKPCGLPREHTSWTIHEVGMDTTTPMVVGAF